MMKWSRGMLVGLVTIAMLAFAPASSAHGGNHGTIKVHDEMDTDPDMRNEPHVDCEFFVEGFNMDGSGGELVFYLWQPSGDQEEVLRADWTGVAEEDGDGFHFLAGPFTLASGHYRVEAFSDEGHPGDHGHFAKSKTFWVECEEVVPEDCPTGLGATANADGSITVRIDAENVTLFRAVGDGEFEAVAFVEDGTYVDTDTEVGLTYTYAVDLDEEECKVQVTAIPVFPGAVAAGLAIGLGVLGYVGLRRRS